MLTLLRPDTENDDYIFSRLVELDRLRRSTRRKDPDRTIKVPRVRDIYIKVLQISIIANPSLINFYIGISRLVQYG